MPNVTNPNDPFRFTTTGNLETCDVVDMDDELFVVTQVGDTSGELTTLTLMGADGKEFDLDCATDDAVWDVKGNTRDGYDLFND